MNAILETETTDTHTDTEAEALTTGTTAPTLPEFKITPAQRANAQAALDNLRQMLRAGDGARDGLEARTKLRDSLAEKIAARKVDGLDRQAAMEAAADTIQRGALDRDIASLEREIEAHEVAAIRWAVRSMPGILIDCLMPYHAQLVEHYTNLLVPLFNNASEARTTLTSYAPALSNLDSFIKCLWRRECSIVQARAQLATLEKLSEGICPWQWNPL